MVDTDPLLLAIPSLVWGAASGWLLLKLELMPQRKRRTCCQFLCLGPQAGPDSHLLPQCGAQGRHVPHRILIKLFSLILIRIENHQLQVKNESVWKIWKIHMINKQGKTTLFVSVLSVLIVCWPWMCASSCAGLVSNAFMGKQLCILSRQEFTCHIKLYMCLLGNVSLMCVCLCVCVCFCV